MMVLLHFPFRNAAPDGIWWFDGSAILQSYYPDNADLALVGGMTLRNVRYRADEHDVPEVFARLVDRPPYPDDWEVVSLSAMEPKAYLDLARKTAAPKVKPAKKVAAQAA